MILDNMVQLSICIPTYNRSTYLAEILQKCISDIEDENLHSTVEILVGDNASSDDTEGVCLTLENKHQYIHYVKNKENIGAERNWLNLISLAQGHYVWILSDDDDFLPGLVADILKITDKADYSVIHLNYTFFEGADKNITFGRRNHETVDYAGRGWQSFFEKTNFSSSFISSNIFSRDNFIANLTSIEPYKANPWFQLYVVKNIINDKAYYCYSAPKLKMRALPLIVSRREKHVGGSPHFYFDAHLAFIEFLVYLKWNSSYYRKRMVGEQLFQIVTEKMTWREITGSEDYNYWFLMIKKMISNGYFNRSLSFWCRDIFVMLLPSALTPTFAKIEQGKIKLVDFLKECECKQGVFPKSLFALYRLYSRCKKSYF
jgi:glycosyltransferase involved in cell wall biosynthesis